MRALALLLVLALSACGGSPTNPTPPSSSLTRVIHLNGDLNFGTLEIGQQLTKNIAIVNNGTGPLTVTNLLSTAGTGSGFATSWSQGTIPSGGQQQVQVRFQPSELRSYSGTMRVEGNQTSGTDTMAITAIGRGPTYSRTGVGDDVFDVPFYVSRVRITATYTGNSSNFVVRIGSRLVVNELVGTGWNQVNFAGNYLLEATGAATVTLSSGVAWTITEIR